MDLDSRKRLILQAVVEDYINTAEPVGSRSISKKPELNLSAATIRNEMGDMEEMGLLVQPHTSAGRIPSTLGYRLYVDNLMKEYQLTANEIERMKDAMLLKMKELDKIIHDVSAAFSGITNLPTFGIMPSLETGSVSSLKIVKIDEKTIMVIISSSSGIIKNKLLRLKEEISDDVIEKMNKILNENLSGLTVSAINLKNIIKVQNVVGDNVEILTSVLELVNDALTEMDNKEVFMEGASNILRFPEYNDIEKIKEIFELFENKKNLGEVADLEPSDDTIRVLIGDEIPIPQLKNNSVILKKYKISDKLTGVIGVIGPERMDYSKMTTNLEFFSKQLEKTLAENFKHTNLLEGDDS